MCKVPTKEAARSAEAKRSLEQPDPEGGSVQSLSGARPNYNKGDFIKKWVPKENFDTH
jgi:hypothetical protein